VDNGGAWGPLPALPGVDVATMGQKQLDCRNGPLVSDIVTDTTQVATDTIDYVATDHRHR